MSWTMHRYTSGTWYLDHSIRTKLNFINTKLTKKKTKTKTKKKTKNDVNEFIEGEKTRKSTKHWPSIPEDNQSTNTRFSLKKKITKKRQVKQNVVHTKLARTKSELNRQRQKKQWCDSNSSLAHPKPRSNSLKLNEKQKNQVKKKKKKKANKLTETEKKRRKLNWLIHRTNR